MPDERSNWVNLSSGGLSAEINPIGAQLSTLRDPAGRDLLWDGDPAIWNGRAPLLFPIVGALAGGTYRLGSKSYPLPRHGFARGKRFDVVESSPAAAMLRLKADQDSFKVYPFHFELEIRFALDGPTLSVTTWICNADDADMPASFGYHPAFRWPLPFGQARESHFVEFAGEEPDPMRRLNADGLLTPVRHPTPIAHRRLALEDALFQDDVMIFDEVRSRLVIYGAETGPRIQVSFTDSPYLGIWTKPRANFICIEPWHGIADPVGFDGDFTQKPGVFTLPARAAVAIRMLITLLQA
ncbi:MAG: aldose 1-epimerase family protein [Steroidobacteraceae bacterium]